jgi:hypothetical protein
MTGQHFKRLQKKMRQQMDLRDNKLFGLDWVNDPLKPGNFED